MAPERQRKPKEKTKHAATAMDMEAVEQEAAPPQGEVSGSRGSSGSSGGVSVMGAVVLAGCMSLGSLALGVWVGRATARRDQYTALRV